MAFTNLSVSYSQIAVFNGALENPFNDWTDRHVEQSFAWRPESVSFNFKTLIEGGPTAVEIRRLGAEPTLEGSRAISVPFDCPPEGMIEIASIADGTATDLRPGSYQLVYESGFRGEQYWCRFTFILEGSREAKILRWESAPAPVAPFLMEAEPA